MKSLVDEKNFTHYPTEKFGEDGQGVLYRTKNDNIIVRESEGRDKKIFEEVKLLPLSSIENLLLPSCCLKEPSNGYVLNIPTGFIPLKTIMTPQNENEKKFYARTGGLKRRLNILINLARTLMELHSLPIMYGSISADRILISKNTNISDIYLLYSSKMSYTMSFKAENDDDPYIAPEVRAGKGGSILSDIYAYAALALDLLTLNGTQPLITDDLQAMFNQVLEGDDPFKRPKISIFYKTFMKTLDLLLVCKKCQGDVYYNTSNCPNCKMPLPKLLRANIYDKISNSKIDRGMKILEIATSRQCFWNYHTENTILNEPPKPTIDCVLNISNDKKLHLIFKNLMEKDIKINTKPVAEGQCHVVALPFEKVVISFNLHMATERYIDLVMI